MARQRKLAAILAVDVVGFSRLIGADEDRTLARLLALCSDLMARRSLVEFRSSSMPYSARARYRTRCAGLPPERGRPFASDVGNITISAEPQSATAVWSCTELLVFTYARGLITCADT
jgi:hypothetical protein